MPGVSNTDKAEILDASVGKSSYEGAGTQWLALLTVAALSTDNGETITEPTYTGAARIEMTAEDWSAASALLGEQHNAVPKLFPECTAGENLVVGWALCEKKVKGEGGRVTKSGRIPPTLIKPGIIPEFLVGTLSFRLADSA